jgi:conjugal transfer pilus assembly protein TraW
LGARILCFNFFVYFLVFGLFSFSIFFNSQAFAKNIGVIGPVYPIAETDLLDLIQHRLETMKENGELQMANDEFKKNSIAYVNNPTPVSEVSHTVKPRTYSFDPTITVEKDIKDQDGNLIAKAGSRVNPLSAVTLNEALLFIDGSDHAQVDWAMKEDKTWQGRDKIILVNGPVVDLMKKYKKQFYLDQEGKLTQQLHITYVPAIVQQKGFLLEISEVEP